MYQAMDAFMNVDTWHTGHPNDGERFYRALDTIVRDKDFHGDSMGDYLRAKANNPALNDCIDDLTTKAHAVRDYLHANGQL
jgi:hypothetical protein